mgnify:CR=1 FL=1
MIKRKFKKIKYFYILFFIALAVSLIYIDLTTNRSGNQTQSDHYSAELRYGMTSENDIKQSLCEYGDNFIASYEVDNIAGVQFHPELSQTNGLKLIKNFLDKF